MVWANCNILGDAPQTYGDPALPSLHLSVENVVRHPDMNKTRFLQFHKHTRRSTVDAKAKHLEMDVGHRRFSVVPERVH